MTNEIGDELYSISCVNCNNQVFKFSRNLLESNGDLWLKCPRCNEETHVIFKGINGIVIEKN